MKPIRYNDYQALSQTNNKREKNIHNTQLYCQRNGTVQKARVEFLFGNGLYVKKITRLI